MLADCICYHRRELIGMDEMYRNLTLQMLLATVHGILLAKAFGSPQWLTSPNDFYDVIVMVKVSFLAALKMLIAPMIFFSLISGISNIGNVMRLRQLGTVTLLYYLVTTSLAVLLGLA